jgi:hypothetical protein
MQHTEFIAVVEVATRTEHLLSDAESALSDYAPVFGRSARGWVEVRLTVPAGGLAHACTTAAAMARVATGAEAIACHVMTQQEYDARQFAEHGRHAAYADNAPTLPRQPTDSSRPWHAVSDRAEPTGSPTP